MELIEKTEAVLGAKAQKTKARNTYTKHEYLRAMLHVAQQQAAYRSCWPTGGTASAETLNAVLALSHHFIMAIASSRTEDLSGATRAQDRSQAVDALLFPDEQPLRVWLRSVQPAVLVSPQVFTNRDGSQGVLYLVSSDTRLNQVQLTTIYQKQWKV